MGTGYEPICDNGRVPDEMGTLSVRNIDIQDRHTRVQGIHKKKPKVD